MNTDYNILSYLIYQILREETFPGKPLQQQQIRQILIDRYGLAPARGTLGRTIHQMETAGCPICGLDSRRGIWLQPECTPLEAEALIQPLITASHFSNQNLDKLLQLVGLLNVEFRKQAKGVKFRAREYLHTESDILFTLGLIKQALEDQTQLQFLYCDLDEKQRPVPRKDKRHPEGKRLVSVHGILCMENHYYMVASEDEPMLRNYRIDKMSQLLITGIKARRISEIPGQGPTFNALSYAARLNYKMFPGKPVSVKFRVTLPDTMNKNQFINIVWDEMGNKAKRFRISDDHNFEFEAEMPGIGAKLFAGQYSQFCEILEPENLRQDMCKEFEQTLRKYKK